MAHLQFFHIGRFSKKIILNSIIFLLLIYFIVHAIYGNRGIIAYLQLNQQLTSTSSKLKHLRGQRVELEHKNKLLRLESLDKDMLDETARNILGVASPNEQVFNPTK